MRWAGRLLAVVALCCGSVLAAAPAAAQGEERIEGYDVELRVEPDGGLVVTESIGYYFGTEQRHGIERNIPVRRRYDDKRDRIYPVTVLQVSATPGTPAEYQTEEQGSDVILRIGDPDRTITGRHDYTIVYRVQGALDGFTDHDELYWNAIGTQWEVPIGRASVRVVTPATVGSAACYRGPRGSMQPCAAQDSDGARAVFEDGQLAPHEGLTVKVGFPAGVVPRPQPILHQRSSFARPFLLVAVLGVLVLLTFVVLLRRRNGGRRGWYAAVPGATSFGPLAHWHGSKSSSGSGGGSSGDGGGGGGGGSW